ncbi:LCP family protein [Actinomycetospora sp. C-140]
MSIETTEKSRRPSGVRVAMFGLGLLMVLVLLAAGGLFALVQHFGNQVGRYPNVFADVDPSTRPSDSPSQTFLLVGTDTRSPDPTTGGDATAPDFVFGAQRSDVIMLATIDANGQHASVVSIPRDSWVDIPGRGMNKINAAYSFGGPPLLISTVEQLTRVHVDHFAVIDFAGFAQMTDAAGGIDVTLPAPTSNAGVNFPAGPQHLNGAQALAYVRQRYGLPGGDFDRVRRQQNALRSLVTSTYRNGTLQSPSGAYTLVDTITHYVGVDDSLSNVDLATTAFGLRDVSPASIDFLTVPTTGTGTEGSASVVYLDGQADDELWFAVNNDQVSQWVATRPDTRLGATPR